MWVFSDEVVGKAWMERNDAFVILDLLVGELNLQGLDVVVQVFNLPAANDREDVWCLEMIGCDQEMFQINITSRSSCLYLAHDIRQRHGSHGLDPMLTGHFFKGLAHLDLVLGLTSAGQASKILLVFLSLLESLLRLEFT